MAQKAITIYTPSTVPAHIYAEDDAQIHRGLIGGSGILQADEQLLCSVTGATTVAMASGVYSNQGFLIVIEGGTAVTFSVDLPSAGAFRKDLLVADFIMGGGNQPDVHTFHIVKGTEASSSEAAADPALIENDLITGGLQRQEALWRVLVDENGVTGVERVAGYIGAVYQ